MASNVTITIRKKLGRYRWTAVSANGRRLAAGRGLKHKHDVIHVLHVLYGPKFNGHTVLDATGESR